MTSVREVGAEERQPENHERQKHPDQGPLCATLPAVYLHPCPTADPSCIATTRPSVLPPVRTVLPLEASRPTADPSMARSSMPGAAADRYFLPGDAFCPNLVKLFLIQPHSFFSSHAFHSCLWRSCLFCLVTLSTAQLCPALPRYAILRLATIFPNHATSFLLSLTFPDLDTP